MNVLDFSEELSEVLEAKKNNLDIQTGMFDIVIFFKQSQETKNDLRIKCHIFNKTLVLDCRSINLVNHNDRALYNGIVNVIKFMCRRRKMVFTVKK